MPIASPAAASVPPVALEEDATTPPALAPEEELPPPDFVGSEEATSMREDGSLPVSPEIAQALATLLLDAPPSGDDPQALLEYLLSAAPPEVLDALAALPSEAIDALIQLLIAAAESPDPGQTEAPLDSGENTIAE